MSQPLLASGCKAQREDLSKVAGAPRYAYPASVALGERRPERGSKLPAFYARSHRTANEKLSMPTNAEGNKRQQTIPLGD